MVLQLNARQLSSPNVSDSEQRCRQLTENLIHKQTTIETLSTERNSLALQLERMQVNAG